MKCLWMVMLVACSAPHDEVDRPSPPAGSSTIVAPVATETPSCGRSSGTTPPSPVVQIVAGIHHSCARLEDRSVWCWGGRGYGQIDNDVNGLLPCAIATRVDELAGATKLVGDCALRADDTVRCGDVARRRFDAPIPIPDSMRGLDEELATAAGTCRRRGPTVSCTSGATEVTLETKARRIARAELGGWWIVRDDGRLVRRELCASCADEIEPLKVTDVASGKGLECVVDSTGTVWCKDERARGARTPSVFAKVEGVRNATQIAVGERHVCVLANREVVCWGRNACGQSGVDTMSTERCGSPDVGPTTIQWAK